MPLSKEKKEAYFEKLIRLLENYNKVFVVEVDNVGSQQLHATRIMMRGTAEVLMGKNTLIRKIINDFLETNPSHPIKSLLDHIGGNVGFVFTNGSLTEVRDMILANRVPAPARVGAIAPADVHVPAGATGCDPGQTTFFQVLQIPTKISKGQIEITNPVHLIKAGEKVGPSESALLSKLNIKPFSYGLGIRVVYDNGSTFDPSILSITPEVIISKFSFALSRVAAISLEIGIPTQASVSHSVANAFNALVAVAINLDNYSFAEADKFKFALANPGAFAAAAPAAGDAAPAAAAAPAPVEEEVDALEGGMDMFGGDAGGGDY
ncbi:RPLP0 [Symbiodinium microadriaticum]|nr:RPLP0 [Symbiodinium microadriaticum]